MEIVDAALGAFHGARYPRVDAVLAKTVRHNGPEVAQAKTVDHLAV